MRQKLAVTAMRDTSLEDLKWMEAAFCLAEKAGALGEIPVGAVVIYDGAIIGEGSNSKETDHNPLAHAEMTALAAASQARGAWRLSGCTLYVTLEPCGMCAGALIQSRIDRLVYGTRDSKTGAVHSLYQMLSDTRLNHQVEVVEGVLADRSQALLKKFFADLRKQR